MGPQPRCTSKQKLHKDDKKATQSLNKRLKKDQTKAKESLNKEWNKDKNKGQTKTKTKGKRKSKQKLSYNHITHGHTHTPNLHENPHSHILQSPTSPVPLPVLCSVQCAPTFLCASCTGLYAHYTRVRHILLFPKKFGQKNCIILSKIR